MGNRSRLKSNELLFRLEEEVKEWLLQKYHGSDHFHRSPEKVVQSHCREYNGISYIVEETKRNPYDPHSDTNTDLILNGIRLPRHMSSSSTLAVQYIFDSLIGSLGIQKDSSREDFHRVCTYHERGSYQIPVVEVLGLEDGNERARKIIPIYVEHKVGIDGAIAEIAKVYPTTVPDREDLMPRLKAQFNLTFM